MSYENLVDRLRAWEVIFPHDHLTYPPKFKLWMCVSRQHLWFLRINSQPITPPDILLEKAVHPFLDHDSWLGCGGDLISITEVELVQCLQRQQQPQRYGIVGHIAKDTSLRASIIAAVQQSPRLSPKQVSEIVKELDSD